MVLKPELAVNLPGDGVTEQQSHKSVCEQATKWQEKICPILLAYLLPVCERGCEGWRCAVYMRGDGEDDFPNYTLSLHLTMLIILINSNW